MVTNGNSHSLSLEGKVAIVSGSSAGIGAAIARELSRRRASVISLDQSLRSIVVEADLSTVEGSKILADAAAARFGPVDILINNAGVTLGSALDDPDDAKVETSWEAMLNLNGRGTYLLTRHVLKILSNQISRIINISSGLSRTPGSGQSMYAGTKGMLETFACDWAKELPRKSGCTVNAVAPGITGTEGFYAAPPIVRETLKPYIDETPVAARVKNVEEVA